MSDTIFRVHPTINFARVGTSEEYYIAPETAAGELVDEAKGIFGGLPIKPNTEKTFIEADDLRDKKNNNVARQAARFRIYAYSAGQKNYPADDPGKEVCIGDSVDGKIIKDIVWTVHLANKKANNYSIASAGGEEEGIHAYQNGKTPPVRNKKYGDNLADPKRLKELVIDAGPRAISSSSNGTQTLEFNATTTCSYADQSAKITEIQDYPVSFPDDYFKMFNPLGAINTLGQMTIEKTTGRLIVVGGYGRASGILENNKPPALNDAIDNDYWFDDTSDGPVNAVILFDDGSTASVVAGWVVTTDPAYAPQTRNVNSVWDDMYTTWVEQLNLKPDLYANNKYNEAYKAEFYSDVLSVFHAALLQRWNTNLPSQGVQGHAFVANIKPTDDPSVKIPDFDSLIRNPNDAAQFDVGGKMPLALGDAMQSFLALTPTQYFLLKQWYNNKSVATATKLGGGEKLDRVVLENCLGGRYSPGIDLTFIVRDVNLYQQNWQGTVGPFRINQQALDYSKAKKGSPFLGVGYVPLRTAQVEPGDLCKFMALPWHTDYNSCATHEPDPNPANNNTLYWSWPAQRPVSVFPADKCTYDKQSGTWSLGGQLFSVRGDEGHGTHTDYPQQTGRYQCYFDFVENWHKVGFVIQGTQIPAPQGGNYGAQNFLEVQSLFTVDGDPVGVWPTSSLPGYKPPKDCGPD